MEQEERAARIAWVFGVQHFDHATGQADQFFVLRQDLQGCVGQVREQGKVEVPVTIPQKSHFEIVDQFLDAARAGEHCRDNDQGPCLGRNALGKVHARQQVRSGQQRGQPIGERHSQVATAEHEEQAEQDERPVAQSVSMGLGRQKCGQYGRQKHDAAAIAEKRRPRAHSAETGDRRTSTSRSSWARPSPTR